MHFLILGATGRTGQLATSEALNRGHRVTALVRNPSSMATQPNLTVLKGSPQNPSDIDRAFTISSEGHPDAVLVTLAASRTSDNPFAKPVSPRFFMRDSVRNAMSAMQKFGTRKLVVLSAFGTGTSWGQLSWPMKLISSMPT